MNDRLNALVGRCKKDAALAQRLFFATRGSELQEQCVVNLLGLRGDLKKLKGEVVKAQDEDAANLLFALEALVTAFAEGLRMWIEVKADHMNEAWDHLVNAQESFRTSLRASPAATMYEGYAKRLELIEAVVFPPQSFVSVGYVALKSECSICGLDAEDCDHIPGRLYMGELCYSIVMDGRLVEVSLVKEPASKRYRVLSIQDGDGVRDILTWRHTQGVGGPFQGRSGVDA